MRRLALAALVVVLYFTIGSSGPRAECDPGPCSCGASTYRNPVSTQYHWSTDSVTSSYPLSGMSALLNSAGQTWVNALAGRRLGGVSFGAGAGGLTLKVAVTSAYWGLHDPASNLLWLSSELWRPDANTPFVQHVLTHEMGHQVAGLRDVHTTGCGLSNTVMWEGIAFNGTGPTSPTGCDLQQLTHLYGSATGDDSCEPPPPECGTECAGDPDCVACECEGRDWLWVEGDPGGYSCESPILIDMSNNTAQYHLTAAIDGVRFDLNNDGVKEQLSWTDANSSVGFLAMDRNGNGSIDSGNELFGNFTRKRSGTLARNGFDALADLESPEHRDGAISPLDSAYSGLLLWRDHNHDGLSSASELSSLSDVGIARIETTYVTRRRRDRYGNRYRYEGVAMLIEDGELRPRRIFDVFFVRAQ